MYVMLYKDADGKTTSAAASRRSLLKKWRKTLSIEKWRIVDVSDGTWFDSSHRDCWEIFPDLPRKVDHVLYPSDFTT